MAIVIKISADTREFEKDIKEAATRSAAAIEQTTGRAINNARNGASGGVTGFGTASRTTSAGGGLDTAASFARVFGGAQAEMKSLETASAAAEAGVGRLGGALGALTSPVGLVVGGLVLVTTSAIAATKAIVDMGKQGSETAKGFLDLAAAQQISVEQAQKLTNGAEDLTDELRGLGGVLDESVIRNAARAFDSFDVLARQWDSFRIQQADALKGSLDDLGTSLQALSRETFPGLGIATAAVGFIIHNVAEDIRTFARVGAVINEFFRPGSLKENAPLNLRGIGIPEPPNQGIPQFIVKRDPVTGKVIVDDKGRETFRTILSGQTEFGITGVGTSPPLTKARKGRTLKEKLSPEVQSALDEQTFFFDQIFGQDEFQLTALIDKTDKNIQKLNAQLQVLASEGLSNSAKATELMNQKLTEQNNLVNALDNRYARLQDTLTGLSEVDKALVLGKGAQLVIQPNTTIAGGVIPGTSEETIATGTAVGAGRPIFNDLAEKAKQAMRDTAAEAQRFRQTIVFTFEDAFREGYTRGVKPFFDSVISGFRNLLVQIVSEASAGLIGALLFGKGGAGTTQGGALSGLGAAIGGGFGGGFGSSTSGAGGTGGGLLGNIFGGGGGGGGLLGSIFGGGGGGSQIGIAPSVSGGTIRLGAGGGGFPLLTGVTGAAGQTGLLAALSAPIGGVGSLLGGVGIGALLGTGLGGKSVGGKILGGIGGAIGGFGVAIGTAVGLAGGGLLAGALAATGFGLLAAPFIIGAILLGKAKQRKIDESNADAIWVSERDQVRQLIAAVNADQIDGQSAIAQASALRQQTIAGLSQIKTKSVRESRLTNQLRDLDSTVIAELRAAVARQATRRNNAGFILPEFASGGVVGGIDQGRDTVTIRATPGELVLNKTQQRIIQTRAGRDVFADAGVPMKPGGSRFQAGGFVSGSESTIVLDLRVDEGIVVGKISGSQGQKVIVNTIKRAQRNGEL